jgi:phage terminase large subunit
MSIQQMQRRIAKLERQRALSTAPLTTGGVPAWMRNGSVPSSDIPYADPVEFSRYAFGHDPWGVQAEIQRSVTNNQRTAVKACHSSGKTFCAAATVLHWITANPDGIAITTAPTWTQVERVLWGEVHRAVQNSVIRYPVPCKSKLELGPNRYALGLSTNEGVRFQGWHGKILIVIDEAPGVLPEIYDAIEGIRAGGDVHVLALGNPLIASGPFYDAFTVNRAGWSLFTIGAFDTPNLAGLTVESLLALDEDELDRNVRPYLISRRWVKEKYQEWGPGNPLWEARVMGQFPKQAKDALLSLTWLEAAQTRPFCPAQSKHTLTAGVDVAGPGTDETVVVVRQGQNILDIRAFTSDDPRGDIVAMLLPYQSRLGLVNVDADGIGWFMAQHLSEFFNVQPIQAGRVANNPEKFVNLKAQLYWWLRMNFESNAVNGLKDNKTIAQLASLQYRHNARGQVVIESKDEARKRGIKSPDRAEAMMLAFCPDLSSQTQIINLWEQGRVRISPF